MVDWQLRPLHSPSVVEHHRIPVRMLALLMLASACGRPVPPPPDSEVQGNSISENHRSRYAGIIANQVKSEFGITNAGLIVGLAYHESGLAHCMGDIDADQNIRCGARTGEIASPYCAKIHGSLDFKDRLWVGQGDPNCPEAGLGLFQLDAVTQSATRDKFQGLEDPAVMTSWALRNWVIGRAIDGAATNGSYIQNWVHPQSQAEWVAWLNQIRIPTLEAQEDAKRAMG